MTEIKIATTCGFCSGAKNVVSKTFKAIEEKKNVVLLKELLHNKNVKNYTKIDKICSFITLISKKPLLLVMVINYLLTFITPTIPPTIAHETKSSIVCPSKTKEPAKNEKITKAKMI